MNLILCKTILQVIIAEKIIDLYPNEKFYGIFIQPNIHCEKYYYYYIRLSEKCCKSKTISECNFYGKKGYLAISKLLLLSYSLPKIKKVFLSSLDNLHIQLLLTFINHSDIITFDDGTLNLNSIVWKKYQQETSKWRRRIFFLRLLNKYFSFPTSEEIIEYSNKHYSIYKYPNVMGESTFLDLFSDQNLKAFEDSEIKVTKRIFIGQPIFESEDNGDLFNKKMTELTTTRFNLQFYYPHPREKYTIDNVEYLFSPLVFEDYILQEIKNNPNTCFEVYSYCSSILLNLAGISIKQLKLIAIKLSNCPIYLEANYKAIKDFGITIREIDVKEKA